MVGTTLNWENELGRRLKPFPDLLGSQGAAGVCPLYVSTHASNVKDRLESYSRLLKRRLRR
jgi:hypothetical protein